MSPRFFQQDPLDFRSLPASVKILAALNVALYVLLVLGTHFHAIDLGLAERFILAPERVFRWPAPELWRLFTHPFVHLDFMPLLVSLGALWFFGAPVAAQWGDREFLNYFFLCTLGAAVPVLLLGGRVAGSTAASYGMLLAFAMLYPDASVYFFFLPMRPWAMIVLFVLLDVMAGTTLNVLRLVYICAGLATGYAYIRWSWEIKMRLKSLLGGLLERAEEERPTPRPTPARRAARPEPDPRRSGEEDDMAEVDRVLDKILVSGMGSLTDEEREIMVRYSRRNKPS